MTHEQAARRIVTVWNLRNPNRNRGLAADDLRGRDLTKTLPSKTRALVRLERTSQAAYDRARAEYERRESDPEYCATVPASTWRPWPRLFDEPVRAIALGNVEASVDELRDALGIVEVVTAADEGAARLAALRERGASIARLVWNHAEDGEFLDQALFQELRGVETYRDGRIDGPAGYLVRSVLAELARELRVTFPERPAMELDWRAAA